MPHPKEAEIKQLFEKPERLLWWLGSKPMSVKVEDELPEEDRSRDVTISDATILYVKEAVGWREDDDLWYRAGLWYVGPQEAGRKENVALPFWYDPLWNLCYAKVPSHGTWSQLHRVVSGYIDQINAEAQPAPS